MLTTNFKILFIVFFQIQCSTPKADVRFELLNEELHFSPIFSNQIGGVEMLYEDYVTEEDKEKAKNVIRYKVTNNLPYNVFFIPKSDEIPYINIKRDAGFPSFLGYSITKENGQNHIDYVYISHSPPKNLLIYQNNLKKDSTEFAQDTIKYKSFYDRLRFKDFTFLAPGKTITFDIEFNLPIVKGSNEQNLLGPSIQPLYKEEEYIFQLHYIQSKSRLEKELPQQILDYLDRNDIRILDLSLHSKKIPLIPR